MKDGSTRMAHKFEQAVDLKTGAVCAVTVQSMDGGDTASLPVTLDEAERQLAAVEVAPGEVVADKGYHSNKTMTGVRDRGLRSYVSELDRGRRNWKRNPNAKKPTHVNRRRIRGDRGKRLLRRRGEKLERGFAHMLETGGLRRVHVCGPEEIPKRILIQAAAFNLGLLMRSLYGIGTPRGLQGLAGASTAVVRHLGAAIGHVLGLVRRHLGPLSAILGSATAETRHRRPSRPALRSSLCSTDC